MGRKNPGRAHADLSFSWKRIGNGGVPPGAGAGGGREGAPLGRGSGCGREGVRPDRGREEEGKSGDPSWNGIGREWGGPPEKQARTKRESPEKPQSRDPLSHQSFPLFFFSLDFLLIFFLLFSFWQGGRFPPAADSEAEARGGAAPRREEKSF